MSGLLPSSSDVDVPDGEPRVIGVDEEDAEALVDALSSETARSILSSVHEEPATASQLAEGTETSLQNAQYHIEKLEAADLLEVVDTRYSAKGREMKVYGATNAPVVLFAGSQEQGKDVRSALTSLIGGVGVVGLGAVIVQEVFGRGFGAIFASRGGGAGGADGASAPQTTQEAAIAAQEATAEPSATVTETMTTETYEMARATEQAAGLPPGLIFFVGGVVALAVLGLLWYVRR
jgi:DNA-binding transcriptional ArsR family regulator